MKYPFIYRLRCKLSDFNFRVEHFRGKDVLYTPLSPDITYPYYTDFINAINDCCEFVHIDLKTFSEYYNEHQEWSRRLWNESKGDPNAYHNKLAQEYAEKNLVANCVCSFALKYSYETIYHYLAELADANKSLAVCDFGCANAHMSFAMMQRKLISNLVLCDLPSCSADFIKFRSQKYGLSAVDWQDVRYFKAKDHQFDAVICFDVLEHLSNPTEVLSTVLYPMLKPGGYLFLQAPWGGGVPSHLDEAISDFYLRGGRRFLSRRFRKIYSMTSLDISGVWIKK